MDRKKRNGILLAVGVIILAVLVLAMVFLLRQDKDTKGASAIKISQTNSSEVTAMRITEDDGHVVEVEKREDGWYYPGEENTSLDQSNMESALTVVCYLFAQGTVKDPAEDMSVYGLDPARMKVEYTLQDGTQHWVAFGSYTSDRQNVFMTCSGSEELYLYDLDSLSILERATQEMTDLTIDISADRVSRIEIMRASGKDPVVMERIPEEERVGMETWLLTSPFTAIANAEAVNLVKAFFASPRYAAYASAEAEEEQGLSDSHAYIRLTEEDGHEVTIHVGNRLESGRYYCAEDGRDGVYELAAGFESLLEIKDENLRPSTILPFTAENSVSIQRGSGDSDDVLFLLENTGPEEYNVNGKNLSEENQKTLTEYLTNFAYNGLAQDAVISGEPDYKVVLHRGERQLVYTFYPYKNDFYAVELNGSGTAGGYVKAENMEILAAAFERASNGETV